MSCYTCLKAWLEKKLSWAANANAAFTGKGYTNWKDATVRSSGLYVDTQAAVASSMALQFGKKTQYYLNTTLYK